MSINKIILHWTAGKYKPNGIDRIHYHFLFDDMGHKYTGRFKPEDNLNCKDGFYAEHCGGSNTGAIGIALCGMMDFKNTRNNP